MGKCAYAMRESKQKSSKQNHKYFSEKVCVFFYKKNIYKGHPMEIKSFTQEAN
jgi:hypothetical protein